MWYKDTSPKIVSEGKSQMHSPQSLLGPQATSIYSQLQISVFIRKNILYFYK